MNINSYGTVISVAIADVLPVPCVGHFSTKRFPAGFLLFRSKGVRRNLWHLLDVCFVTILRESTWLEGSECEHRKGFLT